VARNVWRGLVLAGVSLAAGVVTAMPASAATLLACNAGGAPTLDSGDFAKGHYFYLCNMNPQSVGVTDILETMQITGSGGTFGRTNVPRPASQQSAATALQFCDTGVALCKANADGLSVFMVPRGSYTAVEVVKFFGSFAFGAVGCGRVSATEVDCTWRSASPGTVI